MKKILLTSILFLLINSSAFAEINVINTSNSFASALSSNGKTHTASSSILDINITKGFGLTASINDKIGSYASSESKGLNSSAVGSNITFNITTDTVSNIGNTQSWSSGSSSGFYTNASTRGFLNLTTTIKQESGTISGSTFGSASTSAPGSYDSLGQTAISGGVNLFKNSSTKIEANNKQDAFAQNDTTLVGNGLSSIPTSSVSINGFSTTSGLTNIFDNSGNFSNKSNDSALGASYFDSAGTYYPAQATGSNGSNNELSH